MVGAAALALVITNVFPGMGLDRIWSAGADLRVVGTAVTINAETVVVDGLMTLFFLSVGLEIRREMTHGSLRSPRVATAPVVCALGGMVVPMAIYLALVQNGDAAAGWAIPSATDIGLAVGVAGLVAPQLSAGARAFLLTLAVADDLGGIAVISIWYNDGVSLLPASGALALALVAAAATHVGLMTLAVPCLVSWHRSERVRGADWCPTTWSRS